MKYYYSAILCFLFLSAFSLLPFVAFSSTLITSDDHINPNIVLPTTTTTTSSSSGVVVHDGDDDVVLDTDQEPLHYGTDYYILPIFVSDAGGGVYLTNTDRHTQCPHDVVQHRSSSKKGLPVKFIAREGSSSEAAASQVSLSTLLDIKFSFPKVGVCANQTIWGVENFIDPSTRAWNIKTGDNNEPIDVKNSFKIVKALPTAPDFGYKLS